MTNQGNKKNNALNELLNEITPKEQRRMDKRMQLAMKIDEARQAKRWNRQDLANALGKQKSVITKWLSGTHSFTIQLKRMELLDVKLNQPEQPLPDNMTFNFNLNITYKLNEVKELANIITSISVLSEDYKIQLGGIKSNCVIFIKDLASYVDENKNSSLPDELITSLNSIAISTTRG
ncbi:MAG: hypothetical protein K9I47_11895, partial [Bacteroidales bacterium]|nr:hypothetical protein [Bacteroidales bacterium]